MIQQQQLALPVPSWHTFDLRKKGVSETNWRARWEFAISLASLKDHELVDKEASHRQFFSIIHNLTWPKWDGFSEAWDCAGSVEEMIHEEILERFRLRVRGEQRRAA